MVTMARVHRLVITGLSILASISSAAPTAGDDNTLSAILAPTSAGIANAENVNCFNNCHGISRDTAVQALDWFCKQFDGREMKTSEDNLWGRYQYKPDLEHQYLGYYDEGEIIMTINVTSDAECSPSQTMIYDACFSYGLVPVDSCNTASVEGKQGGTVLNGCLEYGFQPNPKYWPECATEPAEEVKSIDVRAAETPSATHTSYINCYNNCYGIGRFVAVAAVTEFCNMAAGKLFTKFGEMFAHNYLYQPIGDKQNDEFYEEGQIRMVINVTEGVDCNPPRAVLMTFNACFDNVMRHSVDGCNTGGENGKQGGWTTSGCLTYTFQPNLLYYPDCNRGFVHDPPRAGFLEAATAAPPDSTIGTRSIHVAADTISNDDPLVNTRDVPDTSNQDLMLSLAPQSTPSSFITLDLGDEDWTPPFCLNKCFGVSRQIAGTAVDAFAVGLFGDNFRYFKTPADNVRLDYTYTPRGDKFQDHRWIEEGRVRVTIEVIPGTVCDEPYELWNNMAYDIFMKKIIDKCNEDDEHVKQGGWLTHRCLNFTINPNPIYYPNCLTYG